MSEILFHENEIKTNQMTSKAMLAFSSIVFAFGLMGKLGIIDMGPKWTVSIVVFTALTLLLLYALINKMDLGKPYIKDLILIGIILLSGVMYLLYTSTTAFLLYGPILLSIKYYNKRFVIKIAVLSWFVCMLTIFINYALYQTVDFYREYKIYMASVIWEETKDVFIYLVCIRTLLFVVTAGIAYAIAVNGRRLVKEEIELVSRNNEIEAEIKATAQIQNIALQPLKYETPDAKLNIRAYMKSAKEIGGDFYDYFGINENLKVGVVADVSDKGLSAAVFAMKVQTLLRYTLVNSVEVAFDNNVKTINIEKVIGILNNLICKYQASGMFITMYIVCIDVRTGVGKFINAGHIPPYIIHQDGTYELIETEPQLFLGAIPGTEYQASIIELKSGDALFMYTDGITDARNAEDIVFGQDGIETAIKGLNSNFDAEGVTLAVASEVEGFIGGEDQFDDMTMLSFQYMGDKLTPSTTIEINAKEDDITEALDHINGFLEDNNCPKDIIRNTDVVIDELCSNAIEYGFKGNDGKIIIESRLSKNSITLTVKDNSSLFDITQTEDKILPKEPEIGGVGIHLVKNLVDEIHYEYQDGYNIVTLTKVWNI